jgi:hypothetical protein
MYAISPTLGLRVPSTIYRQILNRLQSNLIECISKTVGVGAEGHLANNLLVETVAASKRKMEAEKVIFMSYGNFSASCHGFSPACNDMAEVPTLDT